MYANTYKYTYIYTDTDRQIDCSVVSSHHVRWYWIVAQHKMANQQRTEYANNTKICSSMIKDHIRA